MSAANDDTIRPSREGEVPGLSRVSLRQRGLTEKTSAEQKRRARRRRKGDAASARAQGEAGADPLGPDGDQRDEETGGEHVDTLA